MRRISSFLAAIVVSVLAIPVAGATVAEVHYAMGTYLTIRVDDMETDRARQLMRGCFQEARRLESIFSRYQGDSELNRINRQASTKAMPISGEMRELLQISMALQRVTGGRFDVTIGGLTTLDPKADRFAAPDRRVELNDGGVRLTGRARLDFDGIAKGYAVDRCVALLRAGGVRRALINFGESSQFALGTPLAAGKWPVLLRDLDDRRGIARLGLHDEALSVTTALSRKHGAEVAHIFDPRDGRALRRPALAAVVAESAAVAEAWSKALLLLGDETDEPVGRSAWGYTGALRVMPKRVERLGAIDATIEAFPIAASAEPLR